MTYLEGLAIAVDQLCAALMGCYPDMTLSAQAWLMHLKEKRDWPYKCIDTLFFWQNNHCFEAYRSELERKHVPPELR